MDRGYDRRALVTLLRQPDRVTVLSIIAIKASQAKSGPLCLRFDYRPAYGTAILSVRLCKPACSTGCIETVE